MLNNINSAKYQYEILILGYTKKTNSVFVIFVWPGI
jgi:hypothetical protein